jgi:hypothetical protein
MKFAISIIITVFILASCVPATLPTLSYKRTDEIIQIDSVYNGTLAISSSQEITGYEATTNCSYGETVVGSKNALNCDSPTLVAISTEGVVVARVINNFDAVTQRLIIPKN